MNKVLAEAMGQDDYARLPEAVRMNFTREQWLWLSDLEKATLVQRETECEYDQ